MSFWNASEQPMSHAFATPELSDQEKAARSIERRALVVEDDPGTRSLVSTVLVREGFTVDAAENGRDGLTLLCEGSYSVIVLDLTLPEIQGSDLLAYLLHRDARTLRRVIVMTASILNNRPELPAEVGHVLTKPFELADFHAAVAACADHKV